MLTKTALLWLATLCCSALLPISVLAFSALKCARRALNEQKLFFHQDSAKPCVPFGAASSPITSLIFNRHRLSSGPYLLFGMASELGGKSLNERYRFGSSNHSVLTAAAMLPNAFNATTAGWYRSPMLDVWAADQVLELVNITLSLHTLGVLKTYLVFNGSQAQPGTWFAKSRLLASYPWSLSAIQNYEFHHFTQSYNDSPTAQRSFYMASHGGCDNDVGLMAIIEIADTCYWAAGTPGVLAHAPRFRYAYDATSTGPASFKQNMDTVADELRIEAFIRVPTEFRLYSTTAP